MSLVNHSTIIPQVSGTWGHAGFVSIHRRTGRCQDVEDLRRQLAEVEVAGECDGGRNPDLSAGLEGRSPLRVPRNCPIIV